MIIIKQGDTRSAIKAQLIGVDGRPCDLTGLKVRAIMATPRRRVVLARHIDVVDAPAGRVWLVLESQDVAQPGTYWLEFEVRYDDGRRETYPNGGYVTVMIMPDLEG